MHLSKIVCAVLLSIGVGCATDQRPGDHELVDTDAAPQIKSASDLDVYLRTTPNTPLDRLSPDAKQRFLSSLVFSDKGLGSFHYTELQTLEASEISDIMRLFGLERTTALITGEPDPSDVDNGFLPLLPDYQDKECLKPATCSPSTGDICTHNC